MYPDFYAQSSEPSVVRKKRKDPDMIPNPSLAADGFNIWWQKTAAQNMAMVSEASELMRAHRLVSSAREPRARQVIEGQHARR
jgi:hypothetical protein